MPRYCVTVWASFETTIEAGSQEEAEELAVEKAPFPWADYCETDEEENQ